VKRGEKGVFIGIVVFVILMMARNLWTVETSKEVDKGIPYYTTASADLTRDAMEVYRKQNCKNCHSLWTVRNMLDNVPAPILDGLGSLHSEEWFYQYFSSDNPQSIVPSRLKHEFRMPSYSQLPESDRHLLASYMASLKVKDWYLEETRKAEFEKLTGNEYKP
jgi:cbb3-type cytochrome oxidase cytochrome c subunit